MIFWISAAAVTLAYMVKGLTGFANTLVFSTIMSFFSNNVAITPIEIILGTPSNIFIQLVKLFFGLGVTVVGLETLLADRLKLKPSKIMLVVIGLTAGVMCGMYGIGALLVAYVSRTTDSPSEFRANITFVFLLVDAFRAALYAATGIFTAQVFISALKLAPFMILGMAAGTFMAGKINPLTVKKVIMILLILSGISLIVTNL